MYIAIEPTETDIVAENPGGKGKGLLGYDILGPDQQLEIPVVQTELAYSTNIGKTIEEDWVFLGGPTDPASLTARNKATNNN